MADPKLPTKDEIAKLPIKAMIAYAARCARIIEPIFLESEAPKEYKHAFCKAIRLAENYAIATPPDLSAFADEAMSVAIKVLRAADEAGSSAYINAAAYAAFATYANTTDAVATNAAQSVFYAATSSVAVQDQIIQDFKILQQRALSEKWTDNTPVHPSVFDGKATIELGWPTQNEIANLPRFAIVAFAARCARLVEPIVLSSRFTSYKVAISNAISISERAALGMTSISEIIKATHAIDEAVKPIASVFTYDEEVLLAARAAANAADAAFNAFNADTRATADSAHTALAAAQLACDLAYDKVSASAAKDWLAREFFLLRQKAVVENWANNTNVPRSVFDPLPDILLLRQKDDIQTSVIDKLSFNLWINPGTASKETLQRVMLAISRLHQAAGGGALEFLPDGDFTLARKWIKV